MKPAPSTDPDLILHPVRIRILYALEGRELTPGQIAAEAPDVPQASLYRHLKKLVETGILKVVAERQVHGTVERTYRVDPTAVMVDPKLLVARKHKQAEYFEVFLASLRRAYLRALSQPDMDPRRQGATFFIEFAFLSDVEQIALNREIRRLIAEAQKKAPAPGRCRRALSVLTLPEPPLSPPKPKSKKRKESL
jgi:DNA-binding transcriptional ArsR family regulator